MVLCGSARMGHGTVTGWTDVLPISPDCPRLEAMPTGSPTRAPRFQCRVVEQQRQHPVFGIDLDHVDILNQRDRSADSSFRPDMTNAKDEELYGHVY
jgi:hypothetical protein